MKSISGRIIKVGDKVKYLRPYFSKIVWHDAEVIKVSDKSIRIKFTGDNPLFDEIVVQNPSNKIVIRG